MIHKLINHWNERPSAFLQNPCAFDMKLNKGAIIRRHCSVWEVDDGREKEFPVNMFYSSFFFLWYVQFSPVQYYHMPKFLLFPHPSALRLLPSRGEGLCRFIGGRSSLRGLRGFSHFKRPENKSKWRIVENIRLSPWPIPCLHQLLLL